MIKNIYTIKPILVFLLCFMSRVSFAQTQTAMNFTAAANFKKADLALNAVYHKIFSEYRSDTSFLKNLKISQNIWVKFRDAEMLVRYPGSGDYGSVQPMCWAMYKTELTESRTKALQLWLSGIEEGDVCAGTVKTKDPASKH